MLYGLFEYRNEIAYINVTFLNLSKKTLTKQILNKRYAKVSKSRCINQTKFKYHLFVDIACMYNLCTSKKLYVYVTRTLTNMHVIFSDLMNGCNVLPLYHCNKLRAVFICIFYLMQKFCYHSHSLSQVFLFCSNCGLVSSSSFFNDPDVSGLNLKSHLNNLNLQKYRAEEIREEIRHFIYDKDQLRKNWCLIFLKRLFVTGFYSTIKCTYLFILLRNSIYPKADFSLCRRNTYWFHRTVHVEGIHTDLTEQYNNMELKTFREALFLISKFFNDFFFFFFFFWFSENKNKVWNQNGNVSSETFRRRKLWYSR